MLEATNDHTTPIPIPRREGHRPATREWTAHAIETLINYLDQLDGDPDMEPDADGEDSHDVEEDRSDFEPDQDEHCEFEDALLHRLEHSTRRYDVPCYALKPGDVEWVA